MTSLSQTIEIPLRPVSIDNMSLQKMGFIMNALEKGWTVKKRDDSYVFSKKHEGKKEIFMENYLDTFIGSNFDMNILR